MTNQEAADELQYAIDLIKQDGKDWLDERDIPVLEMAVSALQAQDLQPTCNQLATDTIIRQAAIDALEKCYTCKHVYQRVNGADTLFYRCRRGCKYEEFKPKRSNGNSQ